MTCSCHAPGLRRRALLATATVAFAVVENARMMPAHAQNAAVESAGQAAPRLIEDLVAANRILYDQGVVDGFGHVSARHDRDPNRYLLARSMAPALVTAADIMEYDLDSNPVDSRGRSSYLERFIHGEIYRMRPDVLGIVHSHSPSVIPFADVAVPMRPMTHNAGFMGGGVPVFEIRETAGPATNLLVSNMALGRALAAVLGPHDLVLMRGHGMVTAGQSVRHAVFRAVYAEVNAREEADALRLGTPTYLSDQEARAAATTNDGLVDRPWELWKMRAQHG